jgi:hypothetical protein
VSTTLDALKKTAKDDERTKADPEGRAWFRIAPADLYPAELALPDGSGPETLEPKERAARREALESRRLAFTAALRDTAGGPIGLKITRDARFKL